MAYGESLYCDWIQDIDGVWTTQCGSNFLFSDGTPTDNEFKFCCYCGKELVEKAYENPELCHANDETK